MSKYGFDYFSQRVELLSEMARPSSTLVGPAGERMTQLLAKINGIMRVGGTITNDDGSTTQVAGLPSAKGKEKTGSMVQILGYKYVIGLISGILNDDEVDLLNEPEVEVEKSGKTRDEFRNASMDILGIERNAKDKGLPRPIIMYYKAIGKWTSENEETVLSQEFADRLTDPNKILKFINPEWRREASHSNTGRAKAEEVRDTFGMEVTGYHQIVSSIAPQLKQINRFGHYENMRKNPTVPNQTNIVNSNIATDNIFITIYVLNDMKLFTETIGKVIASNMDLEAFHNTLAYGIDKDEDESENMQMKFYTISTQISKLNQTYFSKKYNLNDDALRGLMNLASNPRYSDYISETIEYFEEFTDGMTVNEIRKELDSQKSFMDEDVHPLLDIIGLKVDELSEETLNNSYPEFSQIILDKVLPTSDLKEKFDTWYNKVYLPERMKKLENKIQSHKDFADTKSAGEHDNLNRASDNLKQKQLDRISKLESEYENSEYSGDDTKEYKESYVMGYMAEQVNKDKFKTKGEFKERGFKKPTNYWQGRN